MTTKISQSRRRKAIEAHLAAHELREKKRRKARNSAADRRKKRGLAAAIAHLRNLPPL